MRFASSGLRQTGNSAQAAGTADLGCGICRSSKDGATAAPVSNAADFSTTSNTLTPGVLLSSILCACVAGSNGGCTDWKELCCHTVLAGLLTASVPAGEPSSDQGGGSSISGGAIAGIVIGVLAVVALLALVVWFSLRRRRTRRSNPEMDKAHHHHKLPTSVAALGHKGAVSELCSVVLTADSTRMGHA